MLWRNRLGSGGGAGCSTVSSGSGSAAGASCWRARYSSCAPYGSARTRLRITAQSVEPSCVPICEGAPANTGMPVGVSTSTRSHASRLVGAVVATTTTRPSSASRRSVSDISCSAAESRSAVGSSKTSSDGSVSNSTASDARLRCSTVSFPALTVRSELSPIFSSTECTASRRPSTEVFGGKRNSAA